MSYFRFSRGFELASVACLSFAFIGCSQLSVPDAASNGDDMPAETDRTDRSDAGTDAITAIDDGETSAESIEPTARVEVEGRIHQFGVMEPNSIESHTFVIKNTGQAPLKLKKINESCKCVLSDLAEGAIPPGGSGSVTLYWKSTTPTEDFEQNVTLGTNDPNEPNLDLTVLGKVLPIVAASPPELVLPRIRPGDLPQTTSLIVSQRLESFTIENLECSLKGAQLELKPAQPGELKALNSKSGWKLTVTLPIDLPTGGFEHYVQFDAVDRPTAAATSTTPADDAGNLAPSGAEGDNTNSVSVDSHLDEDAGPLKQRLEMPLYGKVLRRIGVYGKGIDSTGRIRLGSLSHGEKLERRFSMTVNDSDKDLRLVSLKSSHDFLTASIEPQGTAGQETRKGLYRLILHVKPDAPVGDYQGDQAIKLTATFDHPRIPELQLQIEMVVGRRARLTALVR